MHRIKAIDDRRSKFNSSENLNGVEKDCYCSMQFNHMEVVYMRVLFALYG